MKLISLNIELNRHYKTVLDFIKKEIPDVICFQELLEDDFEYFKKEFAMEGVFRVCSLVKPLVHTDIAGKRQGVAIFSKKIINSGSIFYEGSEENLCVPTGDNTKDQNIYKNRSLVWAEIEDINKKTYKYITTHLPATRKGESSPYQLEVLDLLLKELNSFSEFVLCGDMNAPRGKETFSRLESKYKDNIPKEYKTSIDQKLHRAKGLQLMVDGLFTTPKYKTSKVRLVDGISDHMAIVAEIEKK